MCSIIRHKDVQKTTIWDWIIKNKKIKFHAIDSFLFFNNLLKIESSNNYCYIIHCRRSPPSLCTDILLHQIQEHLLRKEKAVAN